MNVMDKRFALKNVLIELSMSEQIIKVIACSLQTILNFDKHYEMKTKKGDLFMILPIKDVGKVKVRLEECSFMPDENFVRFKTDEEFKLWKTEKECLAKFCVNGKLNKDQI